MDWDITIKLSWRDTRAMRPDTLEEKVDDHIMVMSRSLQRALYAAEYTRKPFDSLTGLAAWHPDA